MASRKEMAITKLMGLILLVHPCAYSQIINLKNDMRVFKKHDDKYKTISSNLRLMNKAYAEIETELNQEVKNNSDHIVIHRYGGIGYTRNLVLLCPSETKTGKWKGFEWTYTEKKWNKIREFSINFTSTTLKDAIPNDGNFMLESLANDAYLYLFSYTLGGMRGHSAVNGSIQGSPGVPESTQVFLRKIWVIPNG